jgi:hypothetical protein
MAKSVDPSKFAASLLPLIQRFMGNQPDVLDRVRTQVQNELDAAREMAAQAEAQLAAIDQFQALIEEGSNGEQLAISTRTAVKPSLRKGIVQVLRERPGYWTRDELYAEIVRRGWGPGGKSPRNTFTSRLSELLSSTGPVERIDDGIGIREQEGATA